MISLESKKRFFDKINPKFIDWDFYQQYIDKEPNFSEIGLFVFLRTYSRFQEFLGRREKWCETCLRATEFNFSLDTVSPEKELKKEAKEFFDGLFNLEIFPSGRSLWIGGTKGRKNNSPIFNCTYVNIESISSFSEIYYWLLIGAGTGFSVEKKHLKYLPNFYNKVKLSHDRSEGYEKQEDDTVLDAPFSIQGFGIEELQLSDGNYIKLLDHVIKTLKPNDEITLYVGDSKEGWANAIRILLHLFTFNKEINLKFDYSYIRSEGKRLKSFGGRASGPESFKKTIEKIQSIVNKMKSEKMDSVSATDICNALAFLVHSGGVRRSSQISLGDENDEKFIKMKHNLWQDESMKFYRQTRVMSNNSVVLYSKPSYEKLKDIIQSIKTNGDPGFVALGNSIKKRKEIEGTNPCAEINLRSRQCCNLTTLNLSKFIKNNEIDWEKLEKSLRLVVRAGSRMTLTNQWHPKWDKNQKKDRLLGQSITGVMDAFYAIGKDNNLRWQAKFWEKLRNIVREIADEYHEQLRIPKSASVTTIKPEGTISQLPGCSSGIHRSYAPYFIRRVRFAQSDPLAWALKSLGFKPVPENSEKSLEDAHTWVFAFPVDKSEATEIRQIDEPALSQLERYKAAQNNYIESHNVSITVNVDENEWKKVTDWIFENFESIGNISMFPKFDPNNSSHPLLPYEPVDKKAIERMKFPVFSEDEFIEKIKSFEQEEDEYEILDYSCSGGSCPVR